MADHDLLPAIERNRKRLWLLCYRMLGRRDEADDVCQEAIARALERTGQRRGDDPTGWLLRITTRCCLDHLRKRTVRRRLTELVDPLLDLDVAAPEPGPEQRSIVREDVRFAVIVALQQLTLRQRVALVLVDICERPPAEVGDVLGVDANAVKALLHRARVALERAQGNVRGDVPVDISVVQAFAQAIEHGSIETLARIMAEDVWGIVDGGGIVRAASRPTRGRSVVARRFANAQRQIGVALTVELRSLNGAPALVVKLAAMPTCIVAVIHLVTHDGSVAAILVDRDPRRLGWFGVPMIVGQARVTL